MTLDRDDAAARVTKIFELLEGAPLAPAPIQPTAAGPDATFKQRQPDPDPTPARPNAYQHHEAWLHALMGELRAPFKRLGHPIPERVRIGVAFRAFAGSPAKTSASANAGQTSAPATITTKSSSRQ
jgi:hypothetical protein